MKRHLYVWHRRLGVLTCAVVFSWSLSGFFHPLMSWIKPGPAKMFLKPGPIPQEGIDLSPGEALRRNRLGTFRDLNIIRFEGRTWYQVRIADAGPFIYLDARDGSSLENGEARYATWLARQYLQDFSSPVSEVREVREFDTEYKLINRLLPVHRVQFQRGDGMRAFVDTSTGLLGTLIDNTRGRLMWVFSNFHNWNWLGFNEKVRIAGLMTFALLTVAVAISGLLVYAFFWKSLKPATDGAITHRTNLRMYHRRMGIAVSVTLLM